MKNAMWSVLLLGASFGAFAQAPDDDEDGPGGPPRWGLGIGALVKDGHYAGEGSDVIPIPLVSFEGERFYFRGITAGWRIVDNDAFELAAIAKMRFGGFDVKDLGTAELAANGIDRTLIEDRDIGVDLGLAMEWRSRAGEIEVELLADASGASKGQELTVQYGYPFEFGGGQLTPRVGVSWQSKKMANYYYGTLDEEVARGVVDYKPGSATLPFVGVDYMRPFAEKWALIAFATYARLPSKLQDSPLVEKDAKSDTTVFIGVSRGF